MWCLVPLYVVEIGAICQRLSMKNIPYFDYITYSYEYIQIVHTSVTVDTYTQYATKFAVLNSYFEIKGLIVGKSLLFVTLLNVQSSSATILSDTCLFRRSAIAKIFAIASPLSMIRHS